MEKGKIEHNIIIIIYVSALARLHTGQRTLPDNTRTRVISARARGLLIVSGHAVSWLKPQREITPHAPLFRGERHPPRPLKGGANSYFQG